MPNLLVDIGNTAVKACTSEGMTLGRTYRYQGEHPIEFILSLVERIRPDAVVLASAYRLSPADRGSLQEKCPGIMILDSSNGEVLKKYGLPSYLSYDRAASILAAKYLFKGSGCTVVDFGTTLTVDFTDPEGNYLGGNVSLGLRTRFKALNRYSRSLPLVNTPNEIQKIGTDFDSSVAGGAVMGIMFEIEGYLSLYPGNMVAFTGGDAIYFAKRTKNSIFVVCNLVLMGLALIIDENVKNI